MAPNVGGSFVLTPWMKELPKLSGNNGVAFLEEYTAYAESRAWTPPQMKENLPKHANREHLVEESADWNAVVATIEEEFEETPSLKKECKPYAEWTALQEAGLDVSRYKLEIRKFEAVQTALRGKSVSNLGSDMSLGGDLLWFCKGELRAKIKRKLGEHAPSYDRVKQLLLSIAPKMHEDLETDRGKPAETTMRVLEELRQLRQQVQSLQAGSRSTTATTYCCDLKEAEKKGWVKIENGFVTFPDDARIPLNKGQGGMKITVDARYQGDAGVGPSQAATRLVRVATEPTITHTYHAHLDLAPEQVRTSVGPLEEIPVVQPDGTCVEVNVVKRRRNNDSRVVIEERDDPPEMVDEATLTDKRKPAQFHSKSQADMDFDPKALLAQVYDVAVPVPLRTLVAAAPLVRKELHEMMVKHRIPIEQSMEVDGQDIVQDIPTPTSVRSATPGPSGNNHVQVRSNNVALTAPVTKVYANVGGKSIEVLIDPGAEANLMSEEFFKALPNAVLGQDVAKEADQAVLLGMPYLNNEGWEVYEDEQGVRWMIVKPGQQSARFRVGQGGSATSSLNAATYKRAVTPTLRTDTEDVDAVFGGLETNSSDIDNKELWKEKKRQKKKEARERKKSRTKIEKGSEEHRVKAMDGETWIDGQLEQGEVVIGILSLTNATLATASCYATRYKSVEKKIRPVAALLPEDKIEPRA
ncbi:hypothetical protein BGX28_000786 [Mortierella sp. GBA30]|nr:hypothetical protein BGX28_000786 [Mortierella sp. GBA30]